jgi:plasmid maintenance system killer protein
MKVVQTGRANRLLRKLDPLVRRDALSALNAFAADSTARGLHFEKLRGFRTLYSIRIDRNHRIILRRTDAPDTFEIEDIGPHDVYRRLDEGDD